MTTHAGTRWCAPRERARVGRCRPRWAVIVLGMALGLGACEPGDAPEESGELQVVAQSPHRPGDVATHLVIVTQPRGGTSGERLATPPQVEIRSRRGTRVHGASFPVHAALIGGDGTLSGTTTVDAVDGVATFSDLVVTGVGTMRLRFTSAGLRGAISRPFRMVPTCALAWRWQNPLTRGASLNGVWGSEASDVWAVGASGVIVHFDGTRWSLVPSGVANWLFGVWGSARDDVWAVGQAGLLHWNGSAWSAFALEPPVALTAVWGTAADDVWAVGDGGRILHWQGAAWELVPSGTTADLSSVYGTSPGDAWAVGEVVLHWDGSAWSEVALPEETASRRPFNAVWTSGSADVWLTDYEGLSHWDGRAWTSWNGNGTYGMWGTGPDDVWFAMETIPPPEADAGLLHWNGTDFELRQGTNTKYLSYYAVWGSGPHDIWAVGAGGAMLHGDGTTFAQPYETTAALTSVRGAGREVWVGGVGSDWILDDGTILQGDGSTWEQTPITEYVFDLWPSSPRDAWAVGTANAYDPGGRVFHWDGAAWSDTGIEAPGWLYGVWGAGADDVWAVGGRGGFDSAPGFSIHWNGTAWSEVPIGTSQTLYGVSGHGGDVWAVGGSGTALRWRCGAWRPVATGTTRTLNRVSSRAWNDVWVVGDAGTILRWNGWSWAPVTSPAAADLLGVWARAANDVWIVGRAGTLLHWDGAAWSAFPGVTARSLRDVWGRGPRDVWAVGDGATILHYSCGP